MRQVLAIAFIAIRNTIRSRVVLFLLAFLLLAILGLPFSIKSDGTIAGHVRILLSYTLGAAGFILSIATLWAACAAISTELDEKQMHLLVTKPVHRFQIWLGKWIGLLIINACLLAISGVTAYALLWWRVQPASLSAQDRQILDEEILVARRPCRADLVDVAPAARQELEARRKRGDLPAEVSEEVLLQAFEQMLLNQAYTIPPGQSHRWTFHLPQKPDSGKPLLVRFKASTSLIGPTVIKGRWRAGPAGAPSPFVREQEHIAGPSYSFLLPEKALDGSRSLELVYENIHDEPVTLVFPPKDGVQVLQYAGAFTPNYLRALLLLYLHLALLAALGVTAGSLFSMPVASFISLFVLLLLGMGRLLQGMAASTPLLAPIEGVNPSLWIILLRLLYKALYGLIRPLQGDSPLDRISTGLLVSWAEAGGVFLIKIVLYAGLLGLLGAWIFNRREIARPE